MADEQTNGEGMEGESDQSNPNEVDATEGLRQRIRKELEYELVQQLLEERTDNGVYKGIQRVASKKDRENGSLRQENVQLSGELQELKRQFSEAMEMYNYTSGVLYNNLPDSERQRVSNEIAAINARKMQVQMEDMRRRLAAGQQVQQPERDEFQDALNSARAEADEALRETVSQFGLDPNDKNLDFGDRDEAFATRLKKLNKSLVVRRKQLDAEDKEAVKPKVPVTPTRTGSGSGAGLPDPTGRTTLQRGSAAVLERVRQQIAAR